VSTADTLPGGGLRPQAPGLSRIEIPQQTAATLDDQVEQSADDLLARYAAESADEGEFRETVKGACFANDLAELGKAASWEEAAGDALASFGGSAQLRSRVAELGSDMQDAKTSGDVVALISVFTVCESV